jgi:hypothetical protein
LFAFRLVRDGWRVPSRIIHDEDGWHAEVDDVIYPAHADPVIAPMVAAVWHAGIKLSQADYEWFVAVREDARKHDPEHPALHPREPMDPRRLRPLRTPS